MFHQHADARRTDVIHLSQVEIDVMISYTDGGLDSIADVVGPVGIEPPLELQLQPALARMLGDFHDFN